MLSARNVIVAVIVVACLSVLSAIVSLALPPDSGGMAADSYGTRASGQKAIYDVLRELRLPIERSLGPPAANWQPATTFVLWGPQASLVAMEPAHLHRLRDWVKSGGHVVLAPGSDELWGLGRKVPTSISDGHKEISIWEALDLPKLETETVDIESAQSSEDGKAPPPAPKPEREISFGRFFEKTPAKSWPITIQADGDLTAVCDGLTELSAPEGKINTLKVGDETQPQPSGKIGFSLAQPGEAKPSSYTVVANFPLGKGQVTIVADPQLIENRWLAHGDNAVLGVRLLAEGNRQIVWDEFYHGLTLRGNPFALLRNRSYAAVAAMGLLCLGFWTWRKAISLGPAAAARPPSRRALGEYVDAMAQLFSRSRGGRPFVLAEVRDGVLWALRRRLRLSPGKEQLPQVVAAMARKDPAAARELASAMAALDGAIASRATNVDASTINILEKVTDCLSTHSTSAFATKLLK